LGNVVKEVLTEAPKQQEIRGEKKNGTQDLRPGGGTWNKMRCEKAKVGGGSGEVGLS